ncbi:unnamed protein product [Prunus armeniaca]
MEWTGEEEWGRFAVKQTLVHATLSIIKISWKRNAHSHAKGRPLGTVYAVAQYMDAHGSRVAGYEPSIATMGPTCSGRATPRPGVALAPP